MHSFHELRIDDEVRYLERHHRHQFHAVLILGTAFEYCIYSHDYAMVRVQADKMFFHKGSSIL